MQWMKIYTNWYLLSKLLKSFLIINVQNLHNIVPPTKRGNPFKNDNERQQTIAEDKLFLSDSEIRCFAWTEMSLAIFEAFLHEESEQIEKFLPIIYENAAILISGSSNLRVREFAGQFLRLLSKFHRFL
ncbi:hypothetical protein WUBG_15150 [Wuchereria bancrofti]|uniref:Uncharacterized protein n=1 Tax=Wuchereria bancrofti TaxID=6293 RepID=J9EAB1_WUCBA|nr:hypothetical protein WUBG_15150 [Wuchereria bancrofti]